MIPPTTMTLELRRSTLNASHFRSSLFGVGIGAGKLTADALNFSQISLVRDLFAFNLSRFRNSRETIATCSGDGRSKHHTTPPASKRRGRWINVELYTLKGLPLSHDQPRINVGFLKNVERRGSGTETRWI